MVMVHASEYLYVSVSLGSFFFVCVINGGS